jgi:hypothetical protein
VGTRLANAPFSWTTNSGEIRMASYIDPRTGERREVDDLVRPTSGSSWSVIAVLLIAVILAAWYFYGRATPTVDTNNTSVTQPVPVPKATDPATPSPSATSPAPAAPSNNNPPAAPTTP